MKRLVVFSIVLFFVLSANPIDTSPTIYELQIISPNVWKMEINMFDEDYYVPDSFYVKNSSDSAKVISYERILVDSLSWGPIYIIEQSNLSKTLSINVNNDKVSLILYSGEHKFVKCVKLGAYPDSYLHNLQPNQSICWDMFDGGYYKSNQPTIGDPKNNYDQAKIYGCFYDANDQMITNSTIKFYPGKAFWGEHVGEDGTFIAKYTPRYHSFSSFYIRHDNGSDQTWDINPVEIDLEPGDSIEVNFYSTMTSVIPVIQNTIKLNNYPHPASSYTWFFIDNTDVEASAMRVNVYALNGRKVDSFIPSARQFRYDCSHLPQGSYVLSLQQGSEVLATKKLQILK